MTVGPPVKRGRIRRLSFTAHLQLALCAQRDSFHRPHDPDLESAQREQSSNRQPLALNAGRIKPVDLSLRTVRGNDNVQWKEDGCGRIQGQGLQEQQRGVDAKYAARVQIHSPLSISYIGYIEFCGNVQILVEQGAANQLQCHLIGS